LLRLEKLPLIQPPYGRVRVRINVGVRIRVRIRVRVNARVKIKVKRKAAATWSSNLIHWGELGLSGLLFLRFLYFKLSGIELKIAFFATLSSPTTFLSLSLSSLSVSDS
jgi:hypothetical protein